VTPKQIALVEDKFCQGCTDFRKPRAVLFYDRLFDIAPADEGQCFPNDMFEQRRKLMTMLAGVVKGPRQSRTGFCRPPAHWAKRHVSYGAKAGALSGGRRRIVVDAGEGPGGMGWTPEVADAWSTAYGTLSGYMISEAYGRNQVPNTDIP